MIYLERFKLFIDELDQKIYYRAVGIGSLLFSLFFILLFYWHSGRVAALEQELRKINRGREQVSQLLAQHKLIQEQKAAVASILAEDKTFKIKEYFTRLIAGERLSNKLAKEPEITESASVATEYTEIKLSAHFNNITMQQLVNLLTKIEKFSRIYTKELIVTKALQTPTIDVYLVIATLLEKELLGGA